MCGRYVFDHEKDIEEVNKILIDLNKNHSGEYFKTGEICPTDNAPILMAKDEKLCINILKWGFPKWDGKGVIINARSETANEKKMFKMPLIKMRCVVLSTGFYEWQKKNPLRNKDKFLFLSPESPMLYMAGIYNVFKQGDELQEHFVILTQEANKYISDIHDRMPVMLSKSELKDWILNDDFTYYPLKRDSMVIDRIRAD